MSENYKQKTISHLRKAIETIENNDRYQLAFVLNTSGAVDSEIVCVNMQVLELVGCIEVMKSRLLVSMEKDAETSMDQNAE
jgi:hypothetical protein